MEIVSKLLQQRQPKQLLNILELSEVKHCLAPQQVSFAALLKQNFTEHAKVTRMRISALTLDLMLHNNVDEGIACICDAKNPNSKLHSHFKVESSKVFKGFRASIRDQRTKNLLEIDAETLITN